MDLSKFIDKCGNFCCSFEGVGDITSLKGVPEYVEGYFDCSNTQITSLEGAPKYVGRFFNCSHTQITSLKGSPSRVNWHFDCAHTQITSLEGAPKKCKALSCYGTRITKEQIIDYLRHNNCEFVYSNFGKFYKKDVINKLSVE